LKKEVFPSCSAAARTIRLRSREFASTYAALKSGSFSFENTTVVRGGTGSPSIAAGTTYFTAAQNSVERREHSTT
jgi:hypothetical protein